VISLRPRPSLKPLPALLACALIAVGVSAGQWQSGRALEKDAVESSHAERRDGAEVDIGSGPIDAAAIDGRRVVARGEFIDASTVYWDNRFAGRVSGMAVVTPLRIKGGDTVVLVDRGVVAPGAERTRPPRIAAPSGMVEVRGRAYIAPRRTMELAANADTGDLWQNLTPEKFAQRRAMKVHGFMLRESGTAAPGLVRGPDVLPQAEGGMTAAKHRGYAFQWYSLALVAALLLLFFTFFRHDKSP
jgi:cytochrome oxidase assembly protein ShyY1